MLYRLPRAHSFVLLAWLGFLIFSCSGGNPVEPGSDYRTAAIPFTSINERNARTPSSSRNHYIWGVYTMVLDREAGTIEVVDNRELALHLNVRSILESDWWCPAHNCIDIEFVEIDEQNHLYTIKGSLMNPSWFNGFDVRVVIFYDDKEHRLLNPDDYTMLYHPEEDVNPFRAYAKTVEQRRFQRYAKHSEIFEMYIPPGPKRFLIDFAIDASWPSNCEEPYEIDNFGYDGAIYPDDPDHAGIDQGAGIIYAEVRDWQLNISEVTVDTTPITGHITYLEYNSDQDRWEAPISNSADAPPGVYRCLIGAFSTDDPSLGLYNYIDITVVETPIPDYQSISGHVRDSFLLQELDGSIVSVTNQDIHGYSPEPVSVVNGEYAVNVTTGIYNLLVIPFDDTHRGVECFDVIVTQDEEVKLDLGLYDPTFENPYDPFGGPANWDEITGFAGRVIDTTGSPVPCATVDLFSPDSWSASASIQEFIQSELTDENGYFSMLNVPITVDDNGTLTEYFMRVRAQGFMETEVESLPAHADQMYYKVITLESRGAEMPVWFESFEEDTGWEFHGYYHRQLYDPLIRNISYDPGYSFIALPPDENLDAGLPIPTDGMHYLWYGVEEDGNFLGDWDPDQPQWSGGMSTTPHQGYALSPPIDLAGYGEARIEFDMCYEIEAQLPSHFDEMWLWAVRPGNERLIRFFNPFPDPVQGEFPLSARGFNRSIMWCHHSYDISAFAGHSFQLKFTFSTGDDLYNGCRGQFIDNIRIFAR